MKRTLKLLILCLAAALGPAFGDSVSVQAPDAALAAVPAVIPAAAQASAPVQAPAAVQAGLEIKWQEFRDILGRLEEEYDRLQILETELDRLKNACEDFRILQFYPASLTRLSAADALRIDKAIKANEEAMDKIRAETATIRGPLTDAIAMLRELLFEDQEPRMLRLMEKESAARVQSIIGLKRRINDLWKSQEAALDELFKLAGLPVASASDTGGFDSEFFQMLYYNLGMSSDLYLKRLNAYKDTLVSRMDARSITEIANAEITMVKRRLARGEYAVVERDLRDLERRYEGRIPMNALYYYLGQVAQLFNKTNEAVAYYSQISKTSSYYIKGLAGILQAHYAEGRYSRIDFLYEKLQSEFAGREGINAVYFVVGQAYYELKRDRALVDLAARAEKDKPYYYGILYTLGQSYTRLKDYSTAGAIFRTVTEAAGKAGETDRPFVDRARIALAHMDYSEGKYQQALKQYIDLLDVPTLFADALSGVAWCFIKLENTHKAEIALKKLVNQVPDEPAGCEALLLLSENFLKAARDEWHARNEQAQNATKIRRYRESVDRRFKEKEIDSARYADAITRLEQMRRDNREEEILRYEDVAERFRKAGESVDLLLNSYATGDFINNPFKNLRQELLIRIRDLHLRSSSDGGRQFTARFQDKKEESARKRARILETVIRARQFKVQYLLERREWAGVYAQHMTRTLDAKIQSVRTAPDVPDSVRGPQIAQWQETRKLILKASQSEMDKSQEVLFAELLKLKGSRLDDEQEAFTWYYLAEAYYKAGQDAYLKADEDYEKKMAEYRKLSELFAAKQIAEAPIKPVAPALHYVQAREHYEALLAKYPDSRFADAALYGLMFVSSEEGDRAAAVRYGEALVEKYPGSEYAPQTFLILGEFYFDENKLDLALQRYQAILKYPESKWFDKALYKIGWTYYRLSDVKRAISAFFYLIDEQNAFSDGGLDLELMRQSLLTKESIDYIAISFSETDTTEDDALGLRRAKRFVKKVGNELLGAKIIHRLGDVYRDRLRYNSAIETYREVETMFPDYPDLPRVYYGMIETWEQKGQFPTANDARRQLFAKFNRNSGWAKTQRDSAAARVGDSLAEQSLLDAASYTYSQALEKKSKDLYRQVIDLYWDYIKTYPDHDRASECHYYIAEILFGSGDYLEAARQYMTVSRKYRGSKYCETAAMNAIVAAQNLLKQEEAGKENGGSK